MKGVIINKGEEYYTDMQGILGCLGNQVRQYNWLVSDHQVYFENTKINQLLDAEYCWLPGEKLMDIVFLENNQWIWGVFSAFSKSTDMKRVLSYSLPYALENSDIWTLPITLQHPLAEIEIVAWDSSCTIIKCKDENVIRHVRNRYPLSEDLETYNRSIW